MKIELNPDWSEFLRLLLSRHVKFLLVGGHAVAAHGEPRLTEEGLELGRLEGLRMAIESMAELLGFELDGKQRQKIQAMSAPELERLAQRIRDERRWPGAE